LEKPSIIRVTAFMGRNLRRWGGARYGAQVMAVRML
jgi:hypothetical protein